MPAQLSVEGTEIPGLLVVTLPVHGDARGWFKENWQRVKMTAAGLPDFMPVQHSVSYNGRAGVTRGIHAEPWDKFVSIVHGRAFGAWVDLREGPSFGAVHTRSLDEHVAVFVPRGVGNSYQTLTDETVYSYLVNQHWSPDASYTMLNLADDTVAIDWPVPLSKAEISDKDRHHPNLADVVPVASPRTLVLGSRGQLGRALMDCFPRAESLDRAALDLSDPESVNTFDFSGVDLVINAGAFTAVDAAETALGRREAWATNATGVAALSCAAVRHNFTLVHYSSDYVFDGDQDEFGEEAPFAPLSVYGASKAAGDLAVSVVPRHFLIRTSWVVGNGRNFVGTMSKLARQEASPSVVADQVGRLTFTSDLASATAHLLSTNAPYGTYNVTSTGEPATWADIARRVYSLLGADPEMVVDTTTSTYAAGAPGPVAPRPAKSTLRLDKIMQTGFTPVDQTTGLATQVEAMAEEEDLP